MVRLFRPINLLIALLCMILQHYVLIKPLLTRYSIPILFSDLQFWSMCVATLCILAGGYVINDYFDIEIDAINKSGKNEVGKHISANTTRWIYILLNTTGLLLGGYVSFSVYRFGFLLWFIVPIGLLYFYSHSYKKMLLVGNIVVSACTAMLVGITTVFHYESYSYFLAKNQSYYYAFAQVFYTVFVVTLCLCAFALVATLIREIIKDCEDIKGDEMYGCTTFPIYFGIKKTNAFCIGLNILLLIGLSIIIQYAITHAYWFDMVWGVLLCLILSYQLYFMRKAMFKSDYTKLSAMSKLVFFVGILYPLVFYIGRIL